MNFIVVGAPAQSNRLPMVESLSLAVLKENLDKYLPRMDYV